MWAPSLGILCLVGAHLAAAMLGLYSSSPNVRVLQPLSGTYHQGQVEIAAVAEDGPNGSGVSKVEFQIDSTSGRWQPLMLDAESRTMYRGRWDASLVARGEHALYLRATDYTGNLRTVQVTVTVHASEATPAVKATSVEPKAPTADLAQHHGEEWAEQGATPRG